MAEEIPRRTHITARQFAPDVIARIDGLIRENRRITAESRRIQSDEEVQEWVRLWICQRPTIAGLAIGSKLLSEQPARDRAEHGAMCNAVRLNPALVLISIQSSCISLLLYISGFQIVISERVTFRGYASSFQGNN